jgi:hypothetical protein
MTDATVLGCMRRVVLAEADQDLPRVALRLNAEIWKVHAIDRATRFRELT